MATKNNRKPTPKQGKKAPAPKAQPKKRREQEESTPGGVMWRMGLLLCTGLVIMSLLFASINGGSQYVGITEKDDTKATPTPPVETVDPMQNVEGSDMTPIPPSASPEGDTTVEDSGTAEQSPTP